jgi:hydrogenase expression/formation protein HypC
MPARDARPHAECESDHCITCADDGVPMTVLALDAQSGLAECVDASGGRADVETAIVAGLAPGDRVLVHAGVAIATLGAEGSA